MFEKSKNQDNYTQSTDFKFGLCSSVRLKDGRIGKICAQIAKNFKRTYNIAFGRSDIEYDVHEYELEKASS